MIQKPTRIGLDRHHLQQFAVLGRAEEDKPRVLERRSLRRVLLEDHARPLDDVPAALAADPVARRGPRVFDFHEAIVSDSIDETVIAGPLAHGASPATELN